MKWQEKRWQFILPLTEKGKKARCFLIAFIHLCEKETECASSSISELLEALLSIYESLWPSDTFDHFVKVNPT